jgi:hypothetical protein
MKLQKSVAQHPISAMIIDVSKNQDEKAGDGILILFASMYHFF